jgi:tRNA modification GTPase
MTNNTIAAISTPLGPGGIGIIRISGPDAYAIIKQLFVRKTKGSPNKNKPITDGPFISHRVYYGHILDPASGNLIDEVLAVYMQAPKSFTREDVVEIHSHSGFVVLDRMLSAVVDAGATLSGPGEFTKRAFLNGRIDLTQAEAVVDLINAPCETAVQMASCQVAGGFRDALATIKNSISNLQAQCEASIEFSESGEHTCRRGDLQRTISQSILPTIATLIQRQKDTAIFKDGVLLAIAGVPNVGKSSLLNQLVEKETAIVSDVPGTTRDVVREYFSINGVPVVVCDTAGIHDTTDPVECIGIHKARDHFRLADLVLLVLEATRGISTFEEKMIEEIEQSKTIAVINKDDLADGDSVSDIQNRLKKIRHIRVSAKFGTSIDKLKELIFKAVVSDRGGASNGNITPNLRQRKILEKARHELELCCHAVEAQQPVEVVSQLLNNVLQIFDEISGKRDQEDLYEHIFSQFCVGK